MSWGDRFLADLARPFLAARFLVESVAIGNFSITECKLSSWPLEGYTHCLDPASSSISHGELQVPSWSRTATTARLAVTEQILDLVRPGQVLRLRVGFDGYAVDEFVTVYVGVVRGAAWSNGRWVIDTIDLGYSLQSRYIRETADPRLFASLDGMGAVVDGTAYSPGDTTLHTTTTAAFERDSGGYYLLQVSPSSGADPFLVTATGKTGTSFTGLSTVGLFGTTAVAAAASAQSQVQGCVLLEEHPLQAVRRILVSSGTAGRNGAYDTLPTTWGFSLPDELVAGGDIDRFVALTTPPIGSGVWDLVALEAQDDGQGFLQGFLAPGGFFCAPRQGRITLRGVADPEAHELPDTWDLVDGQVESYAPWDPTVVEARTLRFVWPDVTSYESSETEHLTTRPALRQARIDVPSVWAGKTGWGDSLNDRLRPYLLRRGERLVVSHPGWALAGAAIGDCVRLTARLPRSRFYTSGSGFDRRRMLMVGGGPDWFSGRTRLTLVAHDPSPRESA